MSTFGEIEVAFTILVLGLVAGPASAQSGAAPSPSLSADTVPMGELFEFTVSIPVPPASAVYFPDTLPATVNMESAAPVRTHAEAGPGDDATLTLTYPLIAFGSGALPVPGFDVLIAPRGEQEGVEELPGGSLVGAWADAPQRSGSARLTRIPRQAVWIAPVFTARDLADGVEPMPPNDVSGGSWSWPSLTLILLCSTLLLVTLVSTGRGWLERAAARSRPPPPTPEELRRRALAELDALLAEGLHSNGRLVDFYTRSTDVVRRYVEARSLEWPPSLTSTELMTRLRTRTGDEGVGPLPAEMAVAEVVKFGRRRPDAAAAERHGQALRDWIDASGERTW